MKSIVSYFIKYPVVGDVLMGLILIFGVLGLISLQSTFFPEAESRTILVQVTYPGASPEEIEEGVVLKIEDNLKGITGIERISSISQENAGTITVEVEKGYDTDLLLQDVKNAVDRIPSFPVGMEPPVVFIQENLNFAISFAISGDVSLKALKQIARDVENDLRGVEGISKVALSGFPEEEIEVSLREQDLLAYDLTFREVAAAVAAANLEITGGSIEGEEEELLIRARQKGYYAEDLENIVVKAQPEGQSVLLRDIANVRDRWADNPNRTWINQEPAVVVTVQNTIYEDILFITDYVKEYVEEFNGRYEAVEATVVRDASVNLRQRIDLLVENGVIGFLLVVVLLAIFLNFRLAFWVAISIPIAFAGMFILASFYGLTINVISLFGMILVIGILVDDGIVVSENIFQHWEKGKPPLKAAVDGVMEVMPAITSAILTTVIAFSIFFFLDGRIGEFITDMAFVVIATLIFSLVEAAVILPTHIGHSKALDRKRKVRKVEKFLQHYLNLVRDKGYAPALRFALKYRTLTLAFSIALMIISFGLMAGGFVQTTFFPHIERDNIQIALEMPPGTQESVTENWLIYIAEQVEEVNQRLAEEREDGLEVIEHVQVNLGPTAAQGSVDISLIDSEQRGIPSFEMTNIIREAVGVVPGAEQLTFGGGSPFGKPISVALLSSNIPDLEAAKEALMERLQELTVVKDVVSSDQEGLREINIELTPQARLLGLSIEDVMAQVRAGFFGAEVQRLQRGIDEVRVWVRYGMDERASIGDLEQMRIRLPDGSRVPLQEVADFDIERGVIAIQHLNGQREIRVEADIANPDVSVTELLAEVEETILPPILEQYPTVNVSFEGQSRESAKTGRSAAQIMPILLILMIGLITVTFRSFAQAIVVFILLPFGLIGVIWGHLIHGMPISILSLYGLLALTGIIVNDSLVLISAMNTNLKEGTPFMKAVEEAGVSRFRPILLTSLTTIAGLGPLILEKSFQAQFLVPMAVSVAWGLAVATFIMLFLLPVLLVLLNRMRVYSIYLWKGQKPNAEAVEPAVKETEVKSI